MPSVSETCKTISVLLEHGCQVDAVEIWGSTPLHYAVKGQDLEDQVDALTNLGLTPLHNAAAAGKAVVNLLLNHGADANCITGSSESPLVCAVRGNDVATVQMLLDHGANIHIALEGGQTLLHCASGFRSDAPENGVQEDYRMLYIQLVPYDVECAPIAPCFLRPSGECS